MIEKRIQTLVDFRVICDVCQRAAPESPHQDGALAQAAEAGFQAVYRWNGLEHVETHFCPDCQGKKAEAYRAYDEVRDHGETKEAAR